MLNLLVVDLPKEDDGAAVVPSPSCLWKCVDAGESAVAENGRIMGR